MFAMHVRKQKLVFFMVTMLIEPLIEKEWVSLRRNLEGILGVKG